MVSDHSTTLSTKRDKFRVKLSKRNWTEVELSGRTDLEGKRLHLFQLPLDLPIQCLDGVKLQRHRKSKWSNPVSVIVKDSDSTSVREVEVKARRLDDSYNDMLMQVKDGRLSPCDLHPVSLYQGCQLCPPAEVDLPVPMPRLHRLPGGLRQRFTPIGQYPTPVVKGKRTRPDSTGQADRHSSPQKSKKSKSSRARCDNS